MGWVLLVIIAYLPIIYRIHRRLHYLENEVERLKRNQDKI